MTRPGRLAVLAACAVLALLTAWYAGSRFIPSTPVPSPGSVRLGPDAGADVAGYLARLPADLPPPGVVTLALVQLTAEQPAPVAVATSAGTTPVIAVFRVPVPRVQTALRFEPLDPGVPGATAVVTAQERARLAAAADADRLTGRPRAVAAAEAAALAVPGCPCVLALVVRADRAGLETVAARPGVRAVQAAPPDTTVRELALAPLLPGQTRRADPLPDDGPVPPG
ncbi:MAG: hypothetical protein ACR2GH_06835 [Pseudonocardia sp.]